MDEKAKLLRLPQVRALVGLGKSTIYDKIRAGDFPKPIKLGRASGWLESDVQAWIQQKVTMHRRE